MKSALAAGVLWLAACEEPLGPLSPETVDAITKTKGDAVGFERSGAYLVQVEVVECPCSTTTSATGRPGAVTQILRPLSACAMIEQGPEEPARIDVVATDGVVAFGSAGSDTQLIGPLYEGGRFSAGAVTSIVTFAAEGRRITRLDGDFDRLDNGHDFEATLLNRIAGRTTIENVPVDIDCTEHLELVGGF
jgi:hypothetical protein